MGESNRLHLHQVLIALAYGIFPRLSKGIANDCPRFSLSHQQPCTIIFAKSYPTCTGGRLGDHPSELSINNANACQNTNVNTRLSIPSLNTARFTYIEFLDVLAGQYITKLHRVKVDHHTFLMISILQIFIV
ncbi:GQ67_02533T0 [Komagataella phaffii]|nr:GQ67_02533T0 [Komagataella phaffii]